MRRSRGIRGRRRSVAVALAAGLVLFGGDPANGGPARSCVAPTVSVDRADPVRPGDTVIVTGSGFAAECNDVILDGMPPRISPPRLGIELVLHDSDGHRHRLGSVDADADYGFTAAVVVPSGASGGTARIEAEAAMPVDLVVADDAEGSPEPREVALALGMALVLVALTVAFARRR